MKIVITITFCVLAMGWSIYLWGISMPNKTEQQVKIELYKDCVKTAYTNDRDINNCNKIK